MTSNQNLVEKASLRHKYICDVGGQTFGVSSEHSPKRIPEWFDRVAFSRAQYLFHHYTYVILFSQLFGLFLSLNSFQGYAPLAMTGNSATISKLFTRYLSTTLHVRNWFRYDPFDRTSKAYRSLKLVRGYHHQVATKLNQSDRKLDSGALWMSQWSMAEAQFTFMGLMTIFPAELGFSLFKAEDFHAIYHFWRTIGYCLGIEDRFNICTGSDTDIVELCKQIYWEEWHEKVVTTSGEVEGVRMAKGIAIASTRFISTNSYNAMLRYSAPFMGLDPGRYPLVSLNDKLKYYQICFIFKYLVKYRAGHWVVSRIYDAFLWITVTMRETYRSVMEKLWDDQIRFDADERCPVEVEFNYATVFEAKLD